LLPDCADGHVNGGNLGQRIDTIIGANISQSE
jgi:hypothetical protein